MYSLRIGNIVQYKISYVLIPLLVYIYTNSYVDKDCTDSYLCAMNFCIIQNFLVLISHERTCRRRCERTFRRR